MGDYRLSHVNPGRGAKYDSLYSPGSALAFYWDHFERPYLQAQFAKAAAGRTRARYLDFACGTGRILSLGAATLPDAVGIDVSAPMSDVARSKVPAARIIRGDVLTEPIEVGTFDVITLFRFLVRAGALREEVVGWLRGHIASDGVFIVNNHRNANSIRGLVFRVVERIRRSGAEAEILSDREVRALLARCGFRVVDDFAFGVVPSYRGHLVVPRPLLLWVERRAVASGFLRKVAKNRVYVCRPVAPRLSAA